LAKDGAEFSIDILGVDCRAIVTAQPLYDPQGTRLRS